MTNAYDYFKYTVCEACGKRAAQQRHHRFHKTKWAVKLYGDLMDDERNIQWVCSKCNVSHAGIGLEHWSESKFCEIMGIEIKSKVGK